MRKVKAEIKTDYGDFACIFTPDEVGYTVTCPSVEGVVSWGKNLAEAKKMAREAVELCIEVKVENNMISKGLSFRNLRVKSSA
jgi:predicted RNase H-like HicB family nuclease